MSVVSSSSKCDSDSESSAIFPQAVTIQGQNITTFCAPPLDGSLALPEMYEWHLCRSPNHPVFKYLIEDNVLGTIFWSDVSLSIRRVAKMVHQLMPKNTKDPKEGCDETQVIAIVADSGKYRSIFFLFN